MKIRNAEIKDVPAIRDLLDQLGYPAGEDLLASRIVKLAANEEHFDAVCELDGEVQGFMSMHFIPQIAFEAEYAVISYLIVNAQTRSKGVGKSLEEFAVELAKTRGCRRLYLHSNAVRLDAHRFYQRQGYIEYQKTFIKYL